MEVTILGYVLIPLAVGLFFRSRQDLLYVFVFFAPFSAAAVINFSSPSFGLQPGYLLGMFYVARAIIDHVAGGGTLKFDRARLKQLLPFWLFLAVALLSLIVIPIRGLATVTRPSGATELLHLSTQNVTQFGYLLFTISVMTTIAAERLSTSELRRILRIFVGAGVFACFWGWFEVFTFLVSGVEYPEYLFNNSVSFKQAVGTVFSLIGVRRLSSIAPEPSMLARFLLVPCFIVMYDYFRSGVLYAKKTSLWMSALFVLTLLACASSTGYVGLVVGFGLLILLTARDGGRSFLNLEVLRRLVSAFGGVVVMLFFFGAISFVIAQQVLGLSISDIVTLFDLLVGSKLESGSATVRIQGGRQALDLLGQFPLLGAGWGSHRSFDLVTYVLGNTGLVGFVLFSYGHATVARYGLSAGWYLDRARSALNLRGIHGPMLRGIVLGLGVMLFAKSISEPDILFLDQWILLGLLITGAVTAMHRLHERAQPTES
jgi:hypothetical protein